MNNKYFSIGLLSFGLVWGCSGSDSGAITTGSSQSRIACTTSADCSPGLECEAESSGSFCKPHGQGAAGAGGAKAESEHGAGAGGDDGAEAEHGNEAENEHGDAGNEHGDEGENEHGDAGKEHGNEAENEHGDAGKEHGNEAENEHGDAGNRGEDREIGRASCRERV